MRIPHCSAHEWVASFSGCSPHPVCVYSSPTGASLPPCVSQHPRCHPRGKNAECVLSMYNLLPGINFPHTCNAFISQQQVFKVHNSTICQSMCPNTEGRLEQPESPQEGATAREQARAHPGGRGVFLTACVLALSVHGSVCGGPFYMRVRVICMMRMERKTHKRWKPNARA